MRLTSAVAATATAAAKHFHRFQRRFAGVNSPTPALTGSDIRRLFGLLNDELRRTGTEGELLPKHG